jgi:ATP-dependent RNA helicase DeaD
MDGLRPQTIIGLLNDNVQGRKIDIGRIDLMKSFSFFEVREADRDRVIQNLDGVKAFGRRVSVESAQPTPSDDRKKKIDDRDRKFSNEGYKPHEDRKFQATRKPKEEWKTKDDRKPKAKRSK